MGLALPFLLGDVLDLLSAGDPPRLPHPVRLLGSIIKYWESVLYKARVGAGALFWLAVMGTTGRPHARGAWEWRASLLPWRIAALSYFLYTGLATRSLHQESLKVEGALVKGDLDGARANLSMIVGRENLPLIAGEDMRRAEIETVAENLAYGGGGPHVLYPHAGPARAVLLQGCQHHGQHGGPQKLLVCPVRQGGGPGGLRPQLHPGRLSMASHDSHGLWRWAWIGGGPCKPSGGTGAKPPAPTPGGPKPPWPEPLGVPAQHLIGRLVDKPFIGEARQPLDQERHRQAIAVVRHLSGHGRPYPGGLPPAPGSGACSPCQVDVVMQTILTTVLNVR